MSAAALAQSSPCNSAALAVLPLNPGGCDSPRICRLTSHFPPKLVNPLDSSSSQTLRTSRYFRVEISDRLTAWWAQILGLLCSFREMCFWMDPIRLSPSDKVSYRKYFSQACGSASWILLLWELSLAMIISRGFTGIHSTPLNIFISITHYSTGCQVIWCEEIKHLCHPIPFTARIRTFPIPHVGVTSLSN